MTLCLDLASSEGTVCFGQFLTGTFSVMFVLKSSSPVNKLKKQIIEIVEVSGVYHMLCQRSFSLRCSRTGSRNLCFVYTGSYRLSATQASVL